MTGNRHRGFTLIELLVVMLIIGALLSIAVPRYFKTLEHARETVLKQDLAILREAIDKHYADLGQYPDSLGALVDKRYVRSVPVDPFSKVSDSWTLVQSDDPDHEGIRDLHSGAGDVGVDGTSVASW
ncbi:MAG: ral secretion pathway protein [Gammaproteobacteria bacterium]|jgi:general secretion pathway protein G|nr:ral secretion pathway protein [Gammaproteobacteria bacterium]